MLRKAVVLIALVAATATGAAPADGRAATPALVVASDISYPPFEFYDGQKRPAGIDYELAVALSARLGRTLEFRNVGWDDIIPTVASRQADILMSAMTDTAERQAKLSFVDYMVEGTQAVVATGDPAGVRGLTGLCGHRVAAQTHTTQDALVTALAARCPAKPRIVRVETADLAYPMLAARRVDAVVDGYTSAAGHVAKESLAFAGVPVESSPLGIGVAKDRTDLRRDVQLALLGLIADGTYAKILKKWGLEAEALTTAAIDGGV